VEPEIGERVASTARGRRYVLAAALLWSLGGGFAKTIHLDGQTIAFYRNVSNFPHHLNRAFVESKPETVTTRKYFFQAEQLYFESKYERAADLYKTPIEDPAWEGKKLSPLQAWRDLVLMKNKDYRRDSSNRETTAEIQIRYLTLHARFDGRDLRDQMSKAAVLLPLTPRARWVIRPAMVPLGLCFGAMTGLYVAAIKATTAANAIFLQCTSTFWMIPLSVWLLRERPDRRSVLGIGLATLGIAAIVLYGYDGRPDEGRGIALGLASGLGYAAVTVGLRGFRDLDPIWLSAINNLLGMLALGAWIVLTRGAIASTTPAQTLALFAFGVVQMAIPYALFARGLREIGAPEAGLIALLEPVLNPIWVVLVTGERPAAATLVGGLFLLSGVACRFAPSPRRT